LDELLLKLEALLWHSGIDSMPRILRIPIKLLRFFYAIIRDVLTTTLTLRAMGLVYISILSVVPLLALTFSALKGFGIHRTRVEPALQSLLAPLGEKGVELTNQLMGFVDNVQGGLLAGVGLLLLIYTTVSMIKKIEDSLNYIWRVDNARSFVARFGEYLSIVIVGPLLMVTAIGLIATVGSNALVDQMLAMDAFGPSAVLLGKLSPYLLVSLVFGLLYWFMPNTRVQITAALIGGLTGGVLWATSGVLFATFVVESTRNVTIYASFAIVIIALMWLYISWLILLIGAQASYYYQHPEYLRTGYRRLTVGNQLREQIALSLMLIVAEAFRAGSKPYSSNDVGVQLGMPGILIGTVRQRLALAGLLETGTHDQLIPARDPASISLLDVVQAVRDAYSEDVFNGGNWPPKVNQVFASIEASVHPLLSDMSLYDLLDQDSSAVNTPSVST
jgi:membrane protein